MDWASLRTSMQRQQRNFVSKCEISNLMFIMFVFYVQELRLVGVKNLLVDWLPPKYSDFVRAHQMSYPKSSIIISDSTDLVLPVCAAAAATLCPPLRPVNVRITPLMPRIMPHIMRDPALYMCAAV